MRNPTTNSFASEGHFVGKEYINTLNFTIKSLFPVSSLFLLSFLMIEGSLSASLWIMTLIRQMFSPTKHGPTDDTALP